METLRRTRRTLRPGDAVDPAFLERLGAAADGDGGAGGSGKK